MGTGKEAAAVTGYEETNFIFTGVLIHSDDMVISNRDLNHEVSSTNLRHAI
jgi:hypothetical protein